MTGETELMLIFYRLVVFNSLLTQDFRRPGFEASSNCSPFFLDRLPYIFTRWAILQKMVSTEEWTKSFAIICNHHPLVKMAEAR